MSEADKAGFWDRQWHPISAYATKIGRWISEGKTRDGRADLTNFELGLLDTRVGPYSSNEKEIPLACLANPYVKPACLPISLIAGFFMIIFLAPLFSEEYEMSLRFEKTGVCTEPCALEIVESIPTNLTFASAVNHTRTHEAWADLLRSAKKSVRIAALYWTLHDSGGYPTAVEGQRIYDEIVAAAKRGVKVQIVQNSRSKAFPQNDSAALAAGGYAEVRSMDFRKLFGSGVLHTKFWIVDDHHIYVGSANMDWRSLTEVKELGVVVRNCSCMAIDLQKVFAIYWKVADSNELIREPWHLNLRPAFNHAHPLNISFNGIPMRSFISSSPAPLNAKGRDHDADAIIYVISQAREYVRVAVMDYFPATLYMGEERNYYWGLLDDALRGAAFRGARVDFRPEMLGYLRSMLTINDVLPFHVGGRRGEINVRFFTVPTSPEQRRIDHGRVNHNKYMVTEKMAYVGTSNWAADYFITTAGVGVIFETVENPTIVSEFNAVFERDWTSNYTQQLTSSVDV
ncbi:hypothetical protein M3Y99_01367200 [Aphelenchoides fujianensis]|nr:hypothetical protein M3Y99_01367200 [Aphelenchoides fujianensis]